MSKPFSSTTHLRSQAALVRSLADELDSLLPHGGHGLRAQVVEELSRLGARILETAAALAHVENDRQSA